MKRRHSSLVVAPVMFFAVLGCDTDEARPVDVDTDIVDLTSAGPTCSSGRPSVACSDHPGCAGCVVVAMPDGNRTTEGNNEVRLVVSLTTPPRGPVVVHAASTDASEGVASGDAVFRPAEWWKAQTIVVAGRADNVDDGDQPYQVRFAITAPKDACYRRIEVPEVELVNEDEDVAGLVAFPRDAAITSEQGGSVPVEITLASQPMADVTVTFTVTDPSEAKVSPTSILFTSEDWRRPQHVQVRGVGDLLADGTMPYELVLSTASADTTYANLPPKRLRFQNLDGPAFSGIGDLAGGATDSTASAVSADGTVVVGYGADASGRRAVRWSPDAGLASLEGASGEARAISGAGDIIVGVAHDSGGHPSAVRWVGGAVPEYLPAPPAYNINTGANAISTNGQVIGGLAYYRNGPADELGVTWSGTPPSAHLPNSGVITGLDEDGDVQVGYSAASRLQPADLAEKGGARLPFPRRSAPCSDDTCWQCITPGQCSSRALALSRDGSTIVGWAADTPHRQIAAVAWVLSAAGTPTATALSSQPVAEALAISGDGRIVAGYEEVEQAPVATRWIESESAQIADLLNQGGVSLDGWRLTAVRGVSDDGRVLVGSGVNPDGVPEGWIAVLPPR